jgi:tetratricopeptide (TPR) repeat protein
MSLETAFGSSPQSIEAMIGGLSATLSKGAKGSVFPLPRNVYNLSPPQGRAKTVSHAHLSIKGIIEHLKQGHHLTPDDADAYLPLVQAHIQLGNWKEAIDLSAAAADLFSRGEDPQRDTKMAVAYFFRGYARASVARKLEGEKKLINLKLSEEDFLEAIGLREDFVSAYCYLGVLLATQERWDEAERAFRQAIKIKPDYVGAHNDLGTMYLASGRPRLALKSLKKALELRPNDRIVLRNLAEAYWQLGRWRDAQATYRRAIRIMPKDATLRYHLGAAYAAQGKWQKAAESFTAAVSLKKNYADAYGNLGAVYFKLGRVHDAVEALNRALEIEPGDEATGQSLNEIRYQMLEGVARAQLERTGRKSTADFEAIAGRLAAAREHIFGEQNLDDPFEGYVPEEIVLAFSESMKRMRPEARLVLAAKFLEKGLLSSGKAAQLAGLDRVTFLKGLNRIGVKAPELERKKSAPAPIDVNAAVSVLQSWNEEDPKEQRETWRYLRAALDEDRLSDRKLFG